MDSLDRQYVKTKAEFWKKILPKEEQKNFDDFIEEIIQYMEE